MVELVDALDSDSSGATRTGSTPAGCTSSKKRKETNESTDFISGRL